MIPYDILLIDDEPDYCQALATRAQNKNIRITYFHNLEDGYKELENVRYKGLILDARCMITADQEYETDNFLFIALDRLKDIESKTERHIPFAVNTGYFEDFEKFKRGIEERKAKIFEKARPKDELFEYLLGQIENSENVRIEKKYQDVFMAFEKQYMEDRIRGALLDILKKHDKPAEVQNVLRSLRVVLEEIYKVLENRAMLPRGLSFNKRNHYLARKNFEGLSLPPRTLQNDNTFYQAQAIHKISSNFANHPPRSTDGYPSVYTAIALTHSLLEKLKWFVELMDATTSIRRS